MRSSIKMAFLGSVIVLAVVLLGLLTIISVTMRSSQMEADVAERLEAQGTGIAERFDNVLTRVAGKTDGLATTLSAMNGTYNMTYAEQVIRQLVASDDMIFGSGVWFAPYQYPGGEKWFGPYFSKNDAGKIDLTMDYSNEEYNYPQFAWYKAAIQGPKSVFWDEPAYDPVTNTTMMSSSAPIRANGQVVGVVTVDIGMKEHDGPAPRARRADGGLQRPDPHGHRDEHHRRAHRHPAADGCHLRHLRAPHRAADPAPPRERGENRGW